MRRMLAVAALLAACAAVAHAADQPAPEFRFSGAWRSLAYQLPGACRFIDRLDLTEEQQKALDKVYRDWLAEQREAYEQAAKSLAPLAEEDRKNPEKVRAYYQERANLMRAAQPAPPVDLVRDILSEEQLAKITEADRVLAAWNTWLAAHMAKYETKLADALGPAPKGEPGLNALAYWTNEPFVKGGPLLARLGLTADQEKALQDLRRQYYAEYTAALAPLAKALQAGQISPAAANDVRRAIGARGRDEIQSKYARLIQDLLTADQRTRLDAALAIADERDKAIWEHYAQLVRELAALLPAPQPASAAAAVPVNPSGAKAAEAGPGEKK